MNSILFRYPLTFVAAFGMVALMLASTDVSMGQDKQASAKKTATRTSTQTKDLGWPLFRGNRTSTGVATSKLPENLEVLWEFEVKKGAFQSTPAIVGQDDPRVYIGDLDGKMFALDLKSGKLLWENENENKLGYTTGAAVKDGKIYAGDIDGYFRCFSKDGKELWKYTTDAEINSSANFYKNNVLFGSQDTKLYALNAKTGELDWDLETADQVRCSATVVENRAFVAGCDGALHIINLDTGKEVGAVSIESPTGVTPAARGDMIFVGTEQGGFLGIDWRKAKIVWRFDDPNGAISTRSSPAVSSNHVVFGARNRKVYSLDSETGKENWSVVLKRNIDSSPVIVGDRVFVGSTDGRLYALKLETGEIVWEKQLNGEIVGSPAVAFGRLVIATDRGLVYCLGKK